ncbi:MAG: hypothetical protein AB7F31_04200 [Parachlamydiales bacterium]
MEPTTRLKRSTSLIGKFTSAIAPPRNRSVSICDEPRYSLPQRAEGIEAKILQSRDPEFFGHLRHYLLKKGHYDHTFLVDFIQDWVSERSPEEIVATHLALDEEAKGEQVLPKGLYPLFWRNIGEKIDLERVKRRALTFLNEQYFRGDRDPVYSQNVWTEISQSLKTPIPNFDPSEMETTCKRLAAHWVCLTKPLESSAYEKYVGQKGAQIWAALPYFLPTVIAAFPEELLSPKEKIGELLAHSTHKQIVLAYQAWMGSLEVAKERVRQAIKSAEARLLVRAEIRKKRLPFSLPEPPAIDLAESRLKRDFVMNEIVFSEMFIQGIAFDRRAISEGNLSLSVMHWIVSCCAKARGDQGEISLEEVSQLLQNPKEASPEAQIIRKVLATCTIGYRAGIEREWQEKLGPLRKPPFTNGQLGDSGGIAYTIDFQGKTGATASIIQEYAISHVLFGRVATYQRILSFVLDGEGNPTRVEVTIPDIQFEPGLHSWVNRSVRAAFKEL